MTKITDLIILTLLFCSYEICDALSSKASGSTALTTAKNSDTAKKIRTTLPAEVPSKLPESAAAVQKTKLTSLRTQTLRAMRAEDKIIDEISENIKSEQDAVNSLNQERTAIERNLFIKPKDKKFTEDLNKNLSAAASRQAKLYSLQIKSTFFPVRYKKIIERIKALPKADGNATIVIFLKAWETALSDSERDLSELIKDDKKLAPVLKKAESNLSAAILKRDKYKNTHNKSTQIKDEEAVTAAKQAINQIYTVSAPGGTAINIISSLNF